MQMLLRQPTRKTRMHERRSRKSGPIHGRRSFRARASNGGMPTPLRRRVRVKFAPRLHSASSHSQKNCVDVEAVLNANSNLYLGVYPHRLCFFERGPQAEIAFVFFNAARREEPRLRALAYACGRRFHLCALDLTRPRRRKGGRSAAPCLGQRQCASPSARSVLR